MRSLEFKGITYELRREINFTEALLLAQFTKDFKEAKLTGNKEAEDDLMADNIQLVADMLHELLGLTTADMRKFSLSEAYKLFNLTIERSSQPEKNLLTP